MKVELTVIAEFPPDVTYGKVKKLAQNLGHSKALRASTLTHASICPSNGSPPRHQLKWEVPCIDTKDIAPDSVFTARKQMAAAYRIKLSRIIRRLDRDESPGFDPHPTVFWTWGEGDLMDLPSL